MQIIWPSYLYEALEPAFFTWPGYQVVATRQNFTWAVKNGTFPGITTAPANPGELIILWGTGFGPTNPLAPMGVRIPAGITYNVAAQVSVTVGGKPAIVYGAALAPGYAGLYQIAIQVPPSLGNGDYPVVVTASAVESVQSFTKTFLTVQQPIGITAGTVTVGPPR